MDVQLALKINKLIHDECKDVPHDIGLKVMELIEIHEVNKKTNISVVLPIISSCTELKEMRIKKRLTLRVVENLTGISNSYLSQLENGKIKNPSFDIIQKLNNLYFKDEQ